MSIPYTQDIAACLADRIGEGGLSQDAFKRHVSACAPALAQLRAGRDDATLPFLTLPERHDDLGPLASLAARYRGEFDDVLVLGTGGSSLGGRAVAALAQRHGHKPAGSPRLHFLDNADPDSFEAIFATTPPARLGVLAISKSGGTMETVCQLAVVLERLRKAHGEDALPRHVAVMTERGDSPLAHIAGRFGLPRIDHDPDLGGRYSVLATGALPAMLLGLDTAALRAGAAAVTAGALAGDTDPAEIAPAAGAAIQVGLRAERMVTHSVLMPYSDRLAAFARWYRQLWAESLGKEGGGTTPVDALGAVDQHSQLQLYLGGAPDKLYTLIRTPTRGLGDAIAPDIATHPDLAYLHGRCMGDLLDAEAKATAESLTHSGRPVRQIRLHSLDAYGLGALFQHFMLETAIAAHLMGVNAYDQPAVEDSKRRARSHLETPPAENA